MSLGSFLKEYQKHKDKRERLYNMLSCEFTGTALENHVQILPDAVKEISWVHRFWRDANNNGGCFYV